MLPRLDLTGVDVGKINASPDHQVGVHSMLLYQKKKKKKKASSKIGFLSVLPHRIAKYEALCKFLQNFINILGQLEQNNFTIFCDEGVKLQRKHCSRNQVSSKVSYCVLVLSI